MSRADYAAAVGPTDYPPTEDMWKELEVEIEALRPLSPSGATDAQLLDTVAGKQIVFEWRQRHKLDVGP